MPGRRRRLIALLLAGCALSGVGLELLGARVGRSWSPDCFARNNCDGLTFTVVAELLRARVSPYSGEARARQLERSRLGQPPPFDLPFQYPPNASPIFALRGSLSPRLASYLWTGVTSLALVLALAALYWRAPSGRSALLLMALCTSRLLLFDGFLTQTGALTGALVGIMLLLWDSRPLTAGLALGLLAIKPHYALPVVLVAVVRRQYRLLTGAAAAFAVLCALSLVLHGASLWPAFLVAVREPNPTAPFMINWLGLWTRSVPGCSPPVTLTIAVFGVALCVMTWFLLRVWPRVATEIQLGIMLCGALLFGPNAHPYDLLQLGPVLLARSATSRHSILVAAAVFVVSWLGTAPMSRWLLTAAVMVALAGFVRQAAVGSATPARGKP